MGKAAPDATLDVLPEKIAMATRQSVCSAEPANFGEIEGVRLASVVMTPASYVISDGASGRKARVLQQNNVPVSVTGNATHLVLDDGVSLILTTTSTLLAVVAGGTVTIPAWDATVGDPV